MTDEVKAGRGTGVWPKEGTTPRANVEDDGVSIGVGRSFRTRRKLCFADRVYSSNTRSSSPWLVSEMLSFWSLQRKWGQGVNAGVEARLSWMKKTQDKRSVG